MNTSEYRLQAAAMKHIASAFPQVKAFHVANENKDATSRYFNQQKGVLPGVSDIICAFRATPRSPAVAGAIELKSGDNKLSPSQNKFISAVGAYGWRTAVCYTVKEVHYTLLKWGLEARHHSITEPDFSTAEDKKKAAFDFYKPLPPST